MATIAPQQKLPQETLEQLKFILQKMFDEGQHWIKGIENRDWRRDHYVNRTRRKGRKGPSVDHIAEAAIPVLNYVARSPSIETESAHNYLIVKADAGCLKEAGIVLFRPVLKNNKDNEPQLNFHVWFHCKPAANDDDHLMVGWRLEGPEGGATTHNFFHAQPLRKYGEANQMHGLPDRFSERFPTIPVPASNIVE